MLNFFSFNYYFLLFVIAKIGDNSSVHLKGTRWLIYGQEESLGSDNKRAPKYVVKRGKKQGTKYSNTTFQLKGEINDHLLGTEGIR